MPKPDGTCVQESLHFTESLSNVRPNNFKKCENEDSLHRNSTYFQNLHRMDPSGHPANRLK